MNKADLSQEDLEFLENLERCTPEQRRHLRHVAIRMLTKQINRGEAEVPSKETRNERE